MALTDLKPFDGLSILTTEIDEIEVAHLVKVKPNLGLMCQDCGSRRFKVEGYIPVELEMLVEKHTIITDIDYKAIKVNRVVKCVYCFSTDFVTITNPTQEESNGQK